MADTTSYNNKYRKYLEDDTDTYLGDEVPTSSKIITGGIAAVGLAAGGFLAFRSGLMKDLFHGAIAKAGSYRRGKMVAANQSLRRWSEEEGLGKLVQGMKEVATGKFAQGGENLKAFADAAKSFKSHMDDGMTEHAQRMARTMESQLVDKEFDAVRRMSNMNDSIATLRDAGAPDQNIIDMRKIMEKDFIDSIIVEGKEQLAREKETGFRFATVRDLIEANEIGGVNKGNRFVDEGIRIFEEAGRTADEFLDSKVDDFILIDTNKQIADVRDFYKTFSGMINSATTDFTIPLIKINPLRMFYLDQVFNPKTKPFYHVFNSLQKNPIISGHEGAVGVPHIFVNGKVYNPMARDAAGNIEMVADNMYLADAQAGPIARLTRNVANISVSSFNKPGPESPWLDRVKYSISEFFDIGLQDEPRGQFDLFDMTSWGTAAINKLTGVFHQKNYQKADSILQHAFGQNAEFIAFRRFKTIGESDGMKDFLSQFTAGRENLQEVTTASMFGYSFMERLNATLNQAGLGLSTKHLGSAFDIFKGLMLYRVAPVWAGVELWDYMNYESEELLGVQMSDKLAMMYADTSVELAKVRDALGITDWAKETAPLFVGGEQLADFPIFGRMFDMNDTAEETQEYWATGEDPVRKGRWWPLGNTPYTGGKIDYWEPNWVRRVLSDYQFSESQYGSREEYFQNSWMPTPRHPLAPIRHFITDPYHYEEKHYDDRPYMVTGGIAELENAPLVGPLLNATVGQILKPQRRMHEEAWAGEPIEAGNIQDLPVSTAAGIGLGSGGEVVLATSPPKEVQYNASKALAMYVTSSGDVQLLETEDKQEIWDARQNLRDKSPVGSGRFRQVRMQEPTSYTEGTAEEPMTVTPMHWQQTVGNLHYNFSEMAGFYGFLGTTMTGEVGDEKPILQSSSDMNGYTRAFWDLDIGGFGGDANEIFRRFLPADRKLNEVNEVPNTMPDWMPGHDYFVDFQKGDPYVKVKKGEMRLPGEGYERLYGIDSDKMMRMEIGASFIGYDPLTIREHMMKMDAVKDDFLQTILDKGTDWHKSWEKEMAQKGIASSMEQYVKDPESGISGFYDLYGKHEKVLEWLTENAVDFKFYTAADGSGTDEEQEGYFNKPIDVMAMDAENRKAFLSELLQSSEYALIDPKTRSTKRWEQDNMHFENVQQVNFYADQMGNKASYLIHVDRDHPENGIKVFGFETNPALLEYTKEKVENVRAGIRNDIERGSINRADLYDPIHRFRILADVAPYSKEYRDMKNQLSSINFDEDEKKEIQTIKDQVSMRKDRLRMYPYRFKTANVENDTVTVDRIIDNNTFMAVEFPDNPIRLAGLRAPSAKDDPRAEAVTRELSRTLRPGKKVQIAYDADEMSRVKQDTYNTIQSVVYDSRGRNVNKYLIDQGMVTERDTDFSAPAVHARFSQKQIAFGAAWEEFAHADTILHTKFLQVRSPLESYERREVYGKDWQEWQDPIDDFLVPAVQNVMTHHPLLAIGTGGLLGAAFGSLKSADVGGERVMARYGKIVGGVIGASVMGAAVLYKMLTEAITDEAWVPERRKTERDVEEYFDVLEYIKNNAMFEKYAKATLKQEGFDIKGYIDRKQYEGDQRKKRIKELEDIKQRLYTARPNVVGDLLEELRNIYGIDAPDSKTAFKLINKELNELVNHRELTPVSPLAAKALQYRTAMKQTMYGYEAGDPIANVLAAFPKKEREYIVPFIDSPEEERGRILDIVPKYVRRVLQSAWGMPVDEKMQLKDYFLEHPLPSGDWAGWDERVNLDDIKVKFVDRVGLDPSEFDIWQSDTERAKELDVPTPDALRGRETWQSYADKISDILSSAGLDGVAVDVVESKTEGVHVDLDIHRNRNQDFKRLINSEGQNVM